MRRYSRLAGIGLAGRRRLRHPAFDERARVGVAAAPVPERLQHHARREARDRRARSSRSARVNRYRNVARFERAGRARCSAPRAASSRWRSACSPRPPCSPVSRRSRTPRRPHAPEPLVVKGSDFATTTRVELRITPGTVGPNTFVASVTDYDTGEPVDARRVSLDVRARGAAERDLDPRARARPTRRTRGRPRAPRSHSRGPGRLRCWWRGRAVPSRSRSRSHRNRPTSTSTSRACPASRTCTRSRSRAALQIQSYVDPGEPGRTNQVHVTAFDADGKELPLHGVTLTIHPPDARAVRARDAALRARAPRREHRPDAGTWSFDIAAHAKDGAELVASFQQTFPG